MGSVQKVALWDRVNQRMESHQDEMPLCLILTATVQVQDNMSFVVRRDAATRLEDYKSAFRLWIRNPAVSSILFVENSGFDLSEFRKIANEVGDKQVEFLSFQCPPFDGALGKGYGEMFCLEHCLAHSEILSKSPRFLKVTGRYYLANAATVMQQLGLRKEIDVMCNLEKNLKWADSRAFGGTVDFLRSFFSPMREEINDSKGSAFENVLARACHRLMANNGQWAPLPEALQIHGISGSIGDVFTPTACRRLKDKIKHALYLWCLK
jgi:hypothetical protein